MSYVRALLAGVLVVTLGACTTTWIQDQLAPTRAMTPAGGAFNTALHSEYLWLADAEYSGGQLSDALYYGGKAKKAAAGEAVAPEDPTAQGMSPEAQADAVKAHERLTAALNGGGKEAAPEMMARAQVAYDCMVREWCEIHPAIQGCRDRFMEAMAAVEQALKPSVSAPPARDYLVFFDWDRANIRPDAAQVLDRVVESIKALNAQRVSLIGHADRSGNANYNVRLSQRRADSVLEFLQARGIAANSMTTQARGEADPRVPTPDGVREEENRRVEIILE
jgi:OOP family OmpA-OmpF porin